MDKFDLRVSILEQIFGENSYNPFKREIKFFCPNGCHSSKMKLEINVEKNTGRCWSCDLRGSIFYFLRRFGNQKQRDDYVKTIDKKLSVDVQFDKIITDYPGSFVPIEEITGPLGRMAENYLMENKIDIKIAKKYRIGYCDKGFYENRIIFPSFNSDGQMNYFIGRDLTNVFEKKYLDCDGIKKNNVVFNELYIDWFKPIIITENVKTQYVHHSIDNIIPLLGSDRISDKLFFDLVLNGVNDVFVALDPDMKNKSKKMTVKLQSFGINAKIVPTKKQPDNVSTEEFLHWIEKSYSFSKNDLLKERLERL